MANMIPFNRSNRRMIPNDINSFSNMLDDFFSDIYSPAWDFSKDTFKIDVQDSDQEYVIEADMPGISKDEINLEIKDNSLCIIVKREEKTEEKDKNYLHKERRYASMTRSVYLKDIEADKVDAKLENGVLTVVVPKMEKSESIKKIDIK